jgi:peptidyl-prolyl cis-trans isomerase SurA
MVAWRCFCLVVLSLSGLCLIASPAAPAPRHAAANVPPQQPAPGQAVPAPEMRIAAVVNDEVISIFDLISRMRMVMLSSNLPDTPETRQRIGGQVLRSLVDERLQLQEAKRQNVVATDDELNTALGQIEKNNNMQPGQLNAFLKSRGIDRGSLVDQLTAGLVWAKLVRRQAAQNTEISDEEVDEAMKRLKEHADEPQVRVAEIFLAVDNPSQDAEVRQLAEKLTDQMKQGARFSAVAQQFSQSATAAVGGDIGWVRADQLPPDLGKAVGGMKQGELSAPIRTSGGYYLLLVLDRRNGAAGSGAAGGGAADLVYDLVQVVFPLPQTASDAAKRAAVVEAQGVRAAAKNCADMLRIGKEKAPQLSSEGKLRESEISPQMRGLLAKLAIGQPSEPILQRNGIGVIMVCSKGAAKAAAPASREDLFETLLKQKLDTVSRRYLRDLRRAAYVDVRV